jgi:hypothetical protein
MQNPKYGCMEQRGTFDHLPLTRIIHKLSTATSNSTVIQVFVQSKLLNALLVRLRIFSIANSSMTALLKVSLRNLMNNPGLQSPGIIIVEKFYILPTILMPVARNNHINYYYRKKSCFF